MVSCWVVIPSLIGEKSEQETTDFGSPTSPLSSVTAKAEDRSLVPSPPTRLDLAPISYGRVRGVYWDEEVQGLQEPKGRTKRGGPEYESQRDASS